ncbi:MAG: tetratricopeptide repeat protein [Proteobacteria bacterium]|nr:tetratricopeptide repeat protein [Pseudomonadota bacterium]
MKTNEITGLAIGEARNANKSNLFLFFQSAIDIVVIFLPTLLIYLNAFRGSFQFDDYNVIVFSPVIHSWAAWWADASRGIRPFLKFTYTMNWTSGMGLFGFHLFNIIIHAVNAVLIYALTRKFLENQSQFALHVQRSIAILAALLFGLHPIQTEAVTYISGRSVSLMSAFYLGSLLVYVYGRIGNRKLFLYVLSPLFFILSVATKEVAVTLPLALLLWEITDRLQPFSFRSIIKRQGVHWLLFLLLLLILITHARYGKLLAFSFELRGFYANLLSQIHGVTYLLSRLFLLTGLNIDPDLPVIATWSLPVILEAAFLALFLFVGIITLRRTPWLSFGILWFFLHVMFVNIFVPRNDIINERHFYSGGFGAFLVISAAFGVLFNVYIRNKKIFFVFTFCILLLLGCFTIARNNVYRSEIVLWEDTARKSPQKARVFNNLGYAYCLAGQYDKAKEAYNKALQIDPDFEIVRNNLSWIEKGQ